MSRTVEVRMWAEINEDSIEDLTDTQIIDIFRNKVREFEAEMEADDLFNYCEHEEYGDSGEWIQEGEE